MGIEKKEKKKYAQYHIAFFLFLSIFFISQSWAADLYVDYFPGYCSSCSSGNDNDYDPDTRNCGSGAYKVFTTVQAAVDAMNGGDHIILRDGTYNCSKLTGNSNNGTVTLPDNKDGTSSNYSSIESYPGEWAILDGENRCDDYGGGRPRGVISSGNSGCGATNYWRFERLEIKNGGNPGRTWVGGMCLSQGPFIIRYCYIHDNNATSGANNPSGIRIYNSTDSVIEYNMFKDNGAGDDTSNNSVHLCLFSDYTYNTVADIGYTDGISTKRNEYKYNLFQGGSVGIKHKGNQLFSSRRTFSDTYNTYGDKIHHNIFQENNLTAIRAKQDFVQVYNNIADRCGGGIKIGHERRIYKAVVYNNTIISCNNQGGEESVSFHRITRQNFSYENPYYYGYDYNNIVDDGNDLWIGGEFAFGYSENYALPNYSNYRNTKNYFYRGRDNDVISIAGGGGRSYYTASAYESYNPGSVVYSNPYASSNLLYVGTSGANKYKTSSSHVIETGIRVENGGANISHPYLDGVTIPGYISATNPTHADSGISWDPNSPDPEDAGWVDFVLSLSSLQGDGGGSNLRAPVLEIK